MQDPDPDRRRLAVEGLARISDASLLPAFKKDFQREHNDELKLAYSFAITRLGDHAFLDSLVLCLPSATLGRRCQGYLLEMGRGILPDLYPYLSDPDAEVRAQLCDILAALGDAARAGDAGAPGEGPEPEGRGPGDARHREAEASSGGGLAMKPTGAGGPPSC